MTRDRGTKAYTGTRRAGQWIKRTLQGAVLVAVASSMPAAWSAGPVLAGGGVQMSNVPAGLVSFSEQGALTTIRTVSQNTIINYQRFDIFSGQTLEFIQPSSTSRVLNRVQSADPSQIDGTLLSNGQVFIVNPAGVMFGNGAVVNVGGLYAAAGHITDANFLAGRNAFTSNTGAVQNFGTIHGQQVHLIGGQVANFGQIVVSAGGIVTMSAGNDVYVAEMTSPTGQTGVMVKISSGGTHEGTGVTNSGTITAPHGQVALGAGDLYAAGIYNRGQIKGGQITLDSGGSTNVNTGSMDASSADGKGGAIVMTGDKVGVFGGTLDASGALGGGTILVGGDLHGGGNVPTAALTIVAPGANLKADATGSGNGGKVVVWSDTWTDFAGQISANGGTGGNGGFVETSSKINLQASGSVRANAGAGGQAGSWLLDPQNLTVTGNTNVDVTQSGSNPISFSTSGNNSNNDANVQASQILAALDAGTSVTLNTSPGTGKNAHGDGNITVSANLNKTAGGAATLSLIADGGITINNPISSTSNALNLTMTAQNDVTVGAAITLNGGNMSLKTGGNVTVGGNISTSGGSVLLSAGDQSIAPSAQGTLTFQNNVLLSSAGGDITLRSTDTNFGTNDSVSAVTGTVAFETNQGNHTISVGTGSGTLNLLNSGLAFIVDAGAVRFGSDGTGGSVMQSGNILVQTGNVAAAGVVVETTGTVTLDDNGSGTALAAGGNVTIDAGAGGIVVAHATSGTHAEITSTGSLITLSSGGGIGNTTNHLEIGSGFGGNVAVTAAGDTYINGFGALAFTSLSNAANITSVTTVGDLTLSGNVSGTTVTLTSGGNITGNGPITSPTVTLNASGAIGTTATAVMLGASTTSATLTTAGAGSLGNIHIAVSSGNTGGLAITTAATAQTVTIDSAGDLSVTTDITLGSTDTLVLHAGTGGTGNLTFAATHTLSADQMVLWAGAGNGTTSFVNMTTNAPSLVNGVGLPSAFTQRQDASIADAPVVSLTGAKNLTLESDGGSVTVTTVANVAGTNLTLTGNTGVSVGAALSGANAVLSFASTSGGTTALGGAVVATTGNISITSTGAVTAPGDLTATSGSVSVLGALVLTGNISAAAAGNVTVTGNLTLDQSATVTGNAVTFGGTVNASGSTATDLTVVNGGNVAFSGAVGNLFALGNLAVSGAAGTTTITGPVTSSNLSIGNAASLTGLITSTGTVTVTGAVTLAGNTTVSATGGDVTFLSTIDSTAGGDFALAVTSGGTTWFEGNIGAAAGSTVLGGLTSSGPGTTQLGNTGNFSISTGSPIIFNNDVLLMANTTLNAGNGPVTFAKTVNSEASDYFTLTVTSSGVTTFAGDVGTAANGALGALIINPLGAAGTLSLGGSGNFGIQTNATASGQTGEQTLNGSTIILAGSAGTFSFTSDTGNITFGGQLSSPSNLSLAATTGGVIWFKGGVSAGADKLGTIHAGGGGSAQFGTSGNITVATTGTQQYDGGVTLAGNTTFEGTGLTFSGVVTGSTFNISFITGALVLNGNDSLQGSGNVTIQPLLTSSDIVLGATAGGVTSPLYLSRDTLRAIKDGFASITIGYPAGTGNITIASDDPSGTPETVLFRDPVTIQAGGAGGSITVRAPAAGGPGLVGTGAGDASITLIGNTIALNADVMVSSTTGGNITVNASGGNITLSANTTLTGNAISLTGALNSSGSTAVNLTLVNGGNVVLGGPTGNLFPLGTLAVTGALGTTSISGGMNVDALSIANAVALGGNLTVTGNITFTGTVTLNQDATITGNVMSFSTLNSSGSTAANLTLVNGGNVTFGGPTGNLFALGNVSVTGGTGTTAITGPMTVGNLSLANAATISGVVLSGGNISIAGNLSLATGTLTATAGSIGLSNAVATGSMNAGAALIMTGNLTLAGSASAGADLTVTGTSLVSGNLTATAGNVSLTGPFTLAGNITVASGNNATFGATVDSVAGGDFALIVDAPGVTWFKTNVGGSGPTTFLGGLTTDAAGTTQLGDIGSTSITTGSPIVFNDDVLLLTNTTLTAGNGPVTFAKTVMSSAGVFATLNINNTGLTSFGGNVGTLATQALGQITIGAGGTTTLGGASPITIKTAAGGSGDGSQTYNAGILLASNTTITGTDISFNSTVDSSGSARDLTVNNTGNVVFVAPVGALLTLGALDVTGTAGTTTFFSTLSVTSLSIANGVALNGNLTTTGNLIFSGTVTLDSNVTLTGNVISFSTLNSSGSTAANLTLVNGGNVTFGGPTGNLFPLGQIDVTGGTGTTAITGPMTVSELVIANAAAISGAVTAAGNISITGNLSLTSGTLTATAGSLGLSNAVATGNLFAGTALLVTGNLTLNGNASAGTVFTVGGQLQFTGNATSGGDFSVTGLASVGGNVTSAAGNITLSNTLTLTANTTLAAGLNATFDSTVDSLGGGDFALAVDAPGTTWFKGSVGAAAADSFLGGLTTDAPGTTQLGNGGGFSITVGSPITFNDDVLLLADTTLHAGSGPVTFAKTIEASAGTFATLTVNSTGLIVLGGDIGIVPLEALGQLTTHAGGTTTLGTAAPVAIVTMVGGAGDGSQTFNGSVLLAADTTLGGTAISFNAALNSSGAAHNLTVNNGGNVVFAGPTGNLLTLGTLDVNGATGTTAITGPMTVNELSIADAATIGGVVTSSGNIAITGNLSLTGNITAGTNATVGGTTNATGNIVATAGLITLTGDATVNGNVTAGTTLTASGNLTLAGSATAGGTIHVVGIADLIGGGTIDSTAGNIDLDNTATIAGKLVAGGNVSATNGAMTLTGNITAAGNVTLGATSATGNLVATAGLISLGAPSFVNGNLTAGTTLAASGNLTLAGSATAGGNISVTGITDLLGGGTIDSTGGALTLSSDARITGKLIAGTNVSITGNLTLTGNITAANNVSVTLASNVNGNLVATAGNVSLPGALTLAGNTAVTGAGTVTLGNATGAFNLTVTGSAAGSKIILGAVGTSTSARIGNLTLHSTNLGNAMQLDGNIFAGNIVFGDALASVPVTATIYHSTGDLVIDANGSFTMGQDQKLTVYGPVAPSGNLSITTSASGIGMTLGDISTLGKITLDTGSVNRIIVVQNRTPAKDIQHDGTLTGNNDKGTDLVSALSGPGAFSIRGTVRVVGPVSADNKVQFASGDASADLGPNPNLAFEAGSAQNILIVNQATPLSVTDFSTAAGTVLDLVAQGVGQNPVAAQGTGIPRDVQTLQPDRGQAISGALLDYLQEMGIYARALNPDEVIDYLIGRALYEDLALKLNPTLAEANQVTANRLPYSPVLTAVEAYRALFFAPEVDANGNPVLDDKGKPKMASQDTAIRNSLGQAWLQYTRDEADKATAPAFRAYLEKHEKDDPKFAAALKYLNQLQELLGMIKHLGLTPTEFEASEKVILAKVRPPNIREDDFPVAVEGSSSRSGGGVALTVQPPTPETPAAPATAR